MGIFPEPARRADDVRRRAPAASRGTNRRGTDKRPSGLRLVNAPGVALGLALGLGLAILAPAGFAPAARAHDRIDWGARAAAALADAGEAAAWDGPPIVEQDPPTGALIAADLAALPRIVAREAGDDAVRFGGRSVPLKVVDTILRAAEEAGVDPVYMMALADKESAFDTDARAATSSAQGLFQFVAATWLELIRQFGARYGLAAEAAAVRGRGPGITVAAPFRERVLSLRNDPRIAAAMAAELIRRDRGRIEARLGRPLSTTELYLAHFLGSGDAGRFLSLSGERPEAAADKAFRVAARANRSLFTARDGGRRRGLTVAELHGRIEGMIDRRLSRYAGVTALAGAAEPAPPAPADEPAGNRRVELSEALPPDGV